MSFTKIQVSLLCYAARASESIHLEKACLMRDVLAPKADKNYPVLCDLLSWTSHLGRYEWLLLMAEAKKLFDIRLQDRRVAKLNGETHPDITSNFTEVNDFKTKPINQVKLRLLVCDGLIYPFKIWKDGHGDPCAQVVVISNNVIRALFMNQIGRRNELLPSAVNVLDKDTLFDVLYKYNMVYLCDIPANCSEDTKAFLIGVQNDPSRWEYLD